MARPITFKPKTVDFQADLTKRLERAPEEHAEALLKAYAVLEAANDQGLLDMLHGAIGARDTIINTASKFAAEPEGVAAIRNLLTAAKILTEIDPEMLDRLTKGLANANAEYAKEQARDEEPPSMWEIFKRATSADSRRGISYMTLVLSSIGRALKR